MTHDPLYAASHMQHMANRAGSEKAAMAMTVISVGLLGMMLVKEAREMFAAKDARGHFKEPEGRQWRERLKGERSGRGGPER